MLLLRLCFIFSSSFSASLWSYAYFRNYIVGLILGGLVGNYLFLRGISADRDKLTTTSFSSLFHIGCSAVSLFFILLIPRRSVRFIRSIKEFYDEAVFIGRIHISIPACGLVIAMSARVLKFIWKWIYALYARATSHKAPPILS
jgi:hypothetical protein